MANNKLLTAEEILQMSDDDYMDERQLACSAISLCRWKMSFARTRIKPP